MPLPVIPFIVGAAAGATATYLYGDSSAKEPVKKKYQRFKKAVGNSVGAFRKTYQESNEGEKEINPEVPKDS
jgi:hypothetical protein